MDTMVDLMVFSQTAQSADCNGTIKMQGTLATTSTEADYFDIAGTESKDSKR